MSEPTVEDLVKRVEELSSNLKSLEERLDRLQTILKRVSDHVHLVSTDLMVQAQIIGYILRQKFDMTDQEIKAWLNQAKYRVESEKKTAMLERWYRIKSNKSEKNGTA